MAVKISRLSSGSLKGPGGGGTVARSEGSPSPTSTGSNARGDSISLTGTAAQLQQLESRITQMPVVDAQLVEEVQRQLATGSFRVDPDSSASKLLTQETSLP